MLWEGDAINDEECSNGSGYNDDNNGFLPWHSFLSAVVRAWHNCTVYNFNDYFSPFCGLVCVTDCVWQFLGGDYGDRCCLEIYGLRNLKSAIVFYFIAYRRLINILELCFDFDKKFEKKIIKYLSWRDPCRYALIINSSFSTWLILAGANLHRLI